MTLYNFIPLLLPIAWGIGLWMGRRSYKMHDIRGYCPYCSSRIKGGDLE